MGYVLVSFQIKKLVSESNGKHQSSQNSESCATEYINFVIFR